MTFSKINIEKLFPYATVSEALQGLKQRNRPSINLELMKSEPQEYLYKAPRKLKGFEMYNITRQVNKLMR